MAKIIRGMTEIEFRNLAASKNYEVLGVWLNEHQRVTKFGFSCRHGHQRLFDFLGGPFTGKLVCDLCPSGRSMKEGRKQEVDELHSLAKSRGGKLISTVYLDQKTLMDWECEKGHRFCMSLSSVKYSGSWCSVCAESSGESLTRQLLQGLTGGKFVKSRPPWLVWKTGSCLELDGYCEELSLAFEYQGRQHYEFDKFFHANQDEFDDQLARDEFKRKQCADQGVKLVAVPYHIGTLESEIKKFLLECVSV